MLNNVYFFESPSCWIFTNDWFSRKLVNRTTIWLKYTFVRILVLECAVWIIIKLFLFVFHFMFNFFTIFLSQTISFVQLNTFVHWITLLLFDFQWKKSECSLMNSPQFYTYIRFLNVALFAILTTLLVLRRTKRLSQIIRQTIQPTLSVNITHTYWQSRP